MSGISEKEVIIIGAGPGGYACAIRLAQLGHQVTVVENDSVGGVCLNWGCIPSKALIHAASLYEQLASAETMGVLLDNPRVDMAKMVSWKDQVVKKLTSGISQLFERHGIELVKGYATFKDGYTLEVKASDGSTQTLRGKQFVIATGSSPIELKGFEVDHTVVINSTDALALQTVPKRLVLIGGGVIGLELGVMYAKLGTQVSVVEMLSQLVPGTDKDIAKALQRSLKKRGVELYLESKATKLNVTKNTATLDLETPKGPVTLKDIDKVLVAIGRKPNSASLGLEKAGVTTDAKGFIKVNKQLKTSQAHILAIGDVTAGPLLAHRASKEAMIAANVLDGQRDEVDYRAMPSAIFTDPEIAVVGLTEQQAIEQYGEENIRIGQFPFAASGRALSMNSTEGFVKVIEDVSSDMLLGVHMIGPHVSELIAEGAFAIEMGASAEDLALTVHTHPSLPESLMEAAEAIHQQAIHIYTPPEKDRKGGSSDKSSQKKSSVTAASQAANKKQLV